MSHYPEYDYLIINDDFELALQQLQSIVLAGRAKLRPQAICHADLLNQLLAG
jgi:guanylate kinase